MNYWNDLSLKEKADVMKVAIGNGIYNLSDIRKAYNEYAEGGDTKDKWTIQDEANYREWRDNLPENLKYTDDREYDMIGAYKAGLQPEWNEKDQSYHLGSRDPQTGRILKSSTHPTYSEAIWTDAAMGYYPTYKNGETYTQQLPWENEYSRGGKIHIKPSHRGKFTRLKERTGHSASWFKENGTPAQKKMATFALNARKWKHGDGGPLIDLVNHHAEGGSTNESNNIVDWIIGEEGFNSRPENIGDGKITLGSGLTNSKWHKIYNKKGTWTAEDNRAAVAEEVENRRRWAEQNVPNWTELPADSQNALLSYKYNYNFTPKNSPKLFKALEDKNYEEAARQIDATSSNPRFRKGLQARRQREQEMFMRGINSMNAPESEVIKKPITVQEESIYTPPQSVLDNIAANNGKYMITGYPALAAPQNMLMNALRSSILGIYASKVMDWAKRNHLFESGGPLVDTANKYHR